jgi:hypothetical protein
VALEVVHQLVDTPGIRGTLASRPKPVVPEYARCGDVRETFLYIVIAAARDHDAGIAARGGDQETSRSIAQVRPSRLASW